jgi:uncharacterized OsmC-like protein
MPGHGFIADEPLADEGNDLGPEPYELLAAALGACTAMTIQMYARRRKYPLLEVAVEVEHSREHAGDGKEPRDESRRLDVLRRKIVVRGPLTEEQHADLLRVAQKCPVHKTLKNAPEILDTMDVVA